jgi:hypothetical protein
MDDPVRATDGAMPKKIGPLRAKCKEVMGRASPTVSPHASDDECSVGGGDDDNDCETDLRGALSEQIWVKLVIQSVSDCLVA